MAVRPERLVARLALRQVRRGALVWGVVFGLTVAATIFGYESTFGTEAERQQLLNGLAANAGIRALFGQPRNLDTVAGFTAWRTLGLLPLVAGVWGLLVATRLLRGEEESGRWDTLLSGPLTRVRATLATLGAIALASLAIFLPTFAGLLLAGVLPGDLPLGGSVWFALAACIAAPAFAALGALTSQLAATRRAAAGMAAAIFTATYIVRVAADGSSSLGWLRWATPLGWVEEMRPMAGARPLALLPLLAWTAALTGLALWIARRRDVGGAVLGHSDDRAPRHLLLGGPGSFTLRESLGGVLAWGLGLGATGFLFGLIAKSVSELAGEAGQGLREHLQRTAGRQVDVLSAQGYLSVVFIFIAVALALYACSHATKAREEEASGRLETVLAQPLGRRRWALERLAVAAACCMLVALATALATWAGAAMRDSGVDLAGMLKAALNMLPLAALFLGLAFLALALAPRHTGAIGFGAVGGAYLWEQTGAIVQAPGWTLAISPFHWLALVPSESFDPVASLVMLAIGVVAAAVAVAAFRARDLVSA